ncbi:hypothetical protein H4219_000035 [Mycoemilia scoparia]|uniref:ClpP/crotonase n=1 Tax=Mycoemilia scoparia TaxID=417184 RepID=A0A9W8ABI4_9FUNG|nr:hypothetical protein H4219_000035 [Mycoemilia scoparia]
MSQAESHFPKSAPEKSLVTISTPFPDKPTIFLLKLHHGAENRFTVAFVDALNEALDYVDNIMDNLPEEDANIGGALISTGSGKFYSNGLDIESAMANAEVFYPKFLALIARMLIFRLPTVAAINGHAFAGGCMFSLAHDYRIMRSDRGYICMNEVDIPLGLLPAMAAIVKCKINQPNALRQCVLEGRRFPAKEAVELGFVDKAVDEKAVLPTALSVGKLASTKAKIRGQVIHQLKAEIYRETVIHLLGNELSPAGYLSKL